MHKIKSRPAEGRYVVLSAIVLHQKACYSRQDLVTIFTFTSEAKIGG